MRPPSLPVPMQTVDVDEVDGPERVRAGADRLHDGERRLGDWARRRPTAAVAVGLALLGALVALVALVPALVTAQERRHVLAAAAFPAAVHSVDDAPRERWSVPVDETLPPLLVGDTVVVRGAGPAPGSFDGFDVVTGARRWSVPFAALPLPLPPAERVLCLGVAAGVACTIGADPTLAERGQAPRPVPADRPQDVFVVLDARSGRVVTAVQVPGRVVATAAVEGDVLVASVWQGRLTVRRTDPATGAVRWEQRAGAVASDPARFDTTLRAGAGIVVVVTGGSALVLRADTGERMPPAPRAAGTDETRLLADGTLVRTRYRLDREGVGVLSTLSTGPGAPWLTARGVPVEPEVSDGRSGLVFTTGTVAGGPVVGRVRAYRPGQEQPVWWALAPARDVAVDAADRVVLRSSGVLVGLDAATGEQRWRRTVGLGLGRAFTDGRQVVLERVTPDEGATLLCLDLADGHLVWSARLPEGSTGAVRLGAELYAVGGGRLVALR